MSTPGATYVHLNGRIVRAAQARLSVFDRGLLYSDGLFETLRVYQGRPFLLEQHVGRLYKSAQFLGIILARRPWSRAIEVLLKRNRLQAADVGVRITVTRGIGGGGLLPPAGSNPSTIITVGRLDARIPRLQKRGARVTLLPFSRDGFLAEHKVLNYLPGVLGKVIAERHDAYEGLYVDAERRVTEGTTSNLFVWRRAELCTPPLGGILDGLTRRLVIAAATATGIPVTEQPITVRDLNRADEVFLTSSLAEIIPIVAVDSQVIGTGHIGPRTQGIQQLYRQIVDRILTET